MANGGVTVGTFIDHGTWSWLTSPGVIVTPSSTTAPSTALNIAIDALSVGSYTILFTAPTPDNSKPYTPGADAYYDGLRENLTLSIRNDTGESIQGFNVSVTDTIPLSPPDLTDVNFHPDNYSHFHGVSPSTFSGEVATVFGPGNVIADYGSPTATTIAPNRISVAGTLALAATATGTGLTLHQEEVPLLGRSNNSFTMTIDILPNSVLATSFAIAATAAAKLPTAGAMTPFTFVVTRTGSTAQDVTMNYSVAGSGTNPAAGSDFVGGTYPHGTILFAAGATSQQLTINVKAGLTIATNEGFTVSLSGPTGITVGTAAATASIIGTNLAVASPTISVYRFFDTTLGTHFFTASQSERDSIISSRQDLTYEGVGLTAIDPTGVTAATPAVYRFFDTIHGTHFFTASASEKDNTIATRSDLKFEGIGFYEHTTLQTGDTAVYRFFDTINGTHFYTASTQERAMIVAVRTDLVDEGIGFYAPSSS